METQSINANFTAETLANFVEKNPNNRENNTRLLASEESDYTDFSKDRNKETETKVDKPKFGKSFLKGMLTELKIIVPFYGNYFVGKEYLEQKNAIKDIEALKEGRETTNEKPNKLQSMITGFGLGFAGFIPVLGSYMIGHGKIEQDNAIRKLNGEETKSDGFLKSFGLGLATKIGWLVPILGTYLRGQEVAEQENLTKKINELKTNQK